MLESVLSSLAVVLAGVACFYAYQAAAYARTSTPKRIVDGLEELRARVVRSEEIVALHETRSVQWRAQMDGVLEAVEDALERVDRKRRSTAAAAAKLKAHNGGEPQLTEEQALRQRAQELGLW